MISQVSAFSSELGKQILALRLDASHLWRSLTNLNLWSVLNRIQEFMNFFAKTLADKTPQSGQRQVVEEQGYHGHVYTKDSTLSAILITDKEYPQRVVFGLLNKCTDEFTTAISRDKWSDKSFVNQYYGNQLKEYLSKYQNPHEASLTYRLPSSQHDRCYYFSLRLLPLTGWQHNENPEGIGRHKDHSGESTIQWSLLAILDSSSNSFSDYDWAAQDHGVCFGERRTSRWSCRKVRRAFWSFQGNECLTCQLFVAKY